MSILWDWELRLQDAVNRDRWSYS